MSGLVEPTAIPVAQDNLLPLSEVEPHVQEEPFMNWFLFKITSLLNLKERKLQRKSFYTIYCHTINSY